MSQLKAVLSIAPQDVFGTSATQGTDVGTVAMTGDGRCFRYVLNGATTAVAGKVYQASAQDTGNLNVSGGFAVLAASIGATTLTLSAGTTLTANQLSGGFMAVVVTPGAGITYKIRGNSAVSAGATGSTVTLEDPLLVALTTSSRVIFAPNLYSNIVVAQTPTSSVIGVATSAIPNGQYGWIQTRGICSVLSSGATSAGQAMGLNGTTAGALSATTSATASQGIIGYATGTQVTAEYDLVNLALE